MTNRVTEISKPPQTNDIRLNAWAQEVKTKFDNYLQTLEVPVSKNGILSNYVEGKHPCKLMSAAADAAYFGFVVPISLKEFKEVTIRFIPVTTGTINYSVNMQYGAVGAAYNTSTKTTNVTGYSVTNNLISEIDITSLFTDQVALDQVAIEFVLNALTTTTEVNLISVLIKYI
jgi:hypothetical protein